MPHIRGGHEEELGPLGISRRFMEEQQAAEMNASLQYAFMAEPHFDAKFPNVSGRLERSGGSKGVRSGVGAQSPGSKLDGL